MTDETKSAGVVYEDVASAPVVYFDGVACYGTTDKVVQIELANRVLFLGPENKVLEKFATSGRIRCSATAARTLIGALQQALDMLEKPQESAPNTGKLN